jgi:hypothetical protein
MTKDPTPLRRGHPDLDPACDIRVRNRELEVIDARMGCLSLAGQTTQGITRAGRSARRPLPASALACVNDHHLMRKTSTACNASRATECSTV